jgi:SAM-dependent methyltransferase
MDYRFLPKRKENGDKPAVLDIGCGNGRFLSLARSAGWIACGTDPDPKARETSALQGLTVLADVDDWLMRGACFDFVTLNHVIEHVHDPLTVLKKAAALLRPGGRIYIQTPNIEAQGAELYGADWRGLEPPRHLVLFNEMSMSKALGEAGFVEVESVRQPALYDFVRNFLRADLGFGAAPLREHTHPMPEPKLKDRIKSSFYRKRGEALTTIAVKPE